MDSLPSRVRIALVGVGAIGKRHAEYVRGSARAELVGICDPAPFAADVAHALGVPAYAAVDHMLDGCKPDGVIIATPTQLHAEAANVVVARGIPVLIEKPITDTVDHGKRLVDLAARTQTPILVGHHRRHNIATQRAHAILQSGELGRILAISVLWAVLKPPSYFDVAWRREKGAGPVLINLIHEIDLLRYLSGEINSVTAVTNSRGRGNQVEDTAVAILRFTSGALGTITASDAAPSPWSWDAGTGENPAIVQSGENAFRFLGTDGALELPNLFRWQYCGANEHGWTQPITRESRMTQLNEAYVSQLAHFCCVIRRETKPIVDGEDALRTLETTLAILKSAETGREVSLNSG